MRVIAKMKGHLIINLKKKRTIASVASAAIAAMAMTISVAAASFDFSLNVGEEDYSSKARKTNTLQHATVTVSDGNFVSSDRLYLRVVDNAKDFATETKWVNSAKSILLNYTEQDGVKNYYYYLRGYQGASALYSVEANGTWTP